MLTFYIFPTQCLHLPFRCKLECDTSWKTLVLQIGTPLWAPRDDMIGFVYPTLLLAAALIRWLINHIAIKAASYEY